MDEAFSKGASLLDGSDRNYRVNASRRDKPGETEIHVKDTDVIYVLEGSATFITGGEAVNAQTTSPDELRGSSIRNGESPADCEGRCDCRAQWCAAHQFVEVTNPFLYYVVNVR